MSRAGAGLRIERLRAPSIEALLDHQERYGAQSGADGDLPHGPEEPGEARPRAGRRRSLRSGDRRRVGEPGWLRTWIAVDEARAGGPDAGRVVGAVSLRWVAPSAAPHRAWCTIGLERDWRGAGHGRRLLRTAIAWAEGRSELDWVDLGVFAGNEPAMTLYRTEGFVEVGRIPDRFRVGGRSIEDVLMTRRVAEPAGDGGPDPRAAPRDGDGDGNASFD